MPALASDSTNKLKLPQWAHGLAFFSFFLHGGHTGFPSGQLGSPLKSFLQIVHGRVSSTRYAQLLQNTLPLSTRACVGAAVPHAEHVRFFSLQLKHTKPSALIAL